MASFGGVSFVLTIQGHAYGSNATINIESIPEGSLIVVDIGGDGEERFSGTCVFDSFADLKSMIDLAKAGTEDTLVYAEQSRMAVLVSCQRQQVLPGKHVARCEWILEPE